MPKQRFEVDVPEGTHLSMSRQVDGGYSALLRDDETNDVVTHAVLLTPDDEEGDWVTAVDDDPWEDDEGPEGGLSDELRAQIIEVIADVVWVLGTKAVASATPHVRNWWHHKGSPRLRSSRARISGRFRRLRHRDRPQVETGAGGALPERIDSAGRGAAGERDLEIALPSMTAEEARQHLVVAVMAQALADRERQLLMNAVIVDDDAPGELVAAFHELTTQQFDDIVRGVLRESPQAIDRYFDLIADQMLRTLEGDREPVVLVARPQESDPPVAGDH
jgi:hypothetical protein